MTAIDNATVVAENSTVRPADTMVAVRASSRPDPPASSSR
jgi:hypothetical protein